MSYVTVIPLLVTIQIIKCLGDVPSFTVHPDTPSPMKNLDPAHPLYKYTKPASSIFGTECVGDCISGLCLVNKDGDLEPCSILEGSPRLIFYTARYRQPQYTICRSACVGVVPWCFVNTKGDWDYCNPQKRDLTITTTTYPEVIKTSKNAAPQVCLTPCTYKPISGKYVCRISREVWDMCAPFANVAPPIISETNINTTVNALVMCLSQHNLRTAACNSRRKRADHSDDESDYDAVDVDTCLANDNPDYVDAFRAPDSRGIFNSLAPGTVAMDARGFSSPNDIDVYSNPPPPLTSYATVHNDELGIDLPVTVRARIDTAALDAVVIPRPANAIAEAVPTLLNALQNIRYSYNGIAYDVGHMIGYMSGGPDVDYNFAPQTATLNRGLWLSMERHIRRWINAGRPQAFVDMLIVIYYDPNIRYLPLAFGVNLAYYYTEGRVASLCNDMVYFNHGNRNNRRPRNVGSNYTNPI